VILVDNVVRNGAVAHDDSEDPNVLGVRHLVDKISSDRRLESFALQTVGVKGWDGFIAVRRIA
jgi:predicted O-methyltransferase YrrM